MINKNKFITIGIWIEKKEFFFPISELHILESKLDSIPAVIECVECATLHIQVNWMLNEPICSTQFASGVSFQIQRNRIFLRFILFFQRGTGVHRMAVIIYK